MNNKINIIKVVNSNDPMGIDFVNGELTFKVPETFREEKDDSLNRKNLLLFVKSLSLSSSGIKPEIKKSNAKGEAWPIDSYLWIIRDYLENGYYFNREKKYSKSGRGKIDWKRTLKSMPIVSDGNVIYDKVITSSVAPTNDIIAQIYRLCLKISQTRIGWAFGYSFFVDVNIIKSIAEMKCAIANELFSTFDDVKRIRFKHMQYILNSIEEDDISSANFSYLINNYYYVFERMVDKFFGGIGEEEKALYNPFGSWSVLGHEKTYTSKLETDTVLKQFRNSYIIDAKMYRYGFTGNIKDLPDTSSIQKQLTYGDHAVKNVDDSGLVRNAFIAPCNIENIPLKDDEYISIAKDKLLYIGYSEGEWRYKETDHDKIYTYLIDFNYLLKNYNLGDSEITLDLCKDIEKHIFEAKQKASKN